MSLFKIALAGAAVLGVIALAERAKGTSATYVEQGFAAGLLRGDKPMIQKFGDQLTNPLDRQYWWALNFVLNEGMPHLAWTPANLLRVADEYASDEATDPDVPSLERRIERALFWRRLLPGAKAAPPGRLEMSKAGEP